jgi:two-component system sensor histidine kinase UhpB
MLACLWRVSVRKVKDETKEALLLQQDIKKSRLSKSRFRITEDWYRTIIQSTLDGFFLADLQGNILDVNDALCRMLGYSREELLSMTPCDFDVAFIEAPEKIWQRIREVKESGIDLSVVQHRCKGGRIIYIEASVKYLDIKPGYFFCFNRDITERKQVEEELRNSRQELRRLYAHVQCAQERERAAMAREIHDELGQGLAALKMDLSRLRKNLTKGQDSLVEKTNTMLSLVDSTIKTVRRISSGLRPAILDDLGGKAGVAVCQVDFTGGRRVCQP